MATTCLSKSSPLRTVGQVEIPLDSMFLELTSEQLRRWNGYLDLNLQCLVGQRGRAHTWWRRRFCGGKQRFWKEQPAGVQWRFCDARGIPGSSSRKWQQSGKINLPSNKFCHQGAHVPTWEVFGVLFGSKGGTYLPPLCLKQGWGGCSTCEPSQGVLSLSYGLIWYGPPLPWIGRLWRISCVRGCDWYSERWLMWNRT